MAVEIKSGNSSDLGTIDPLSKALRVSLYSPDGDLVDTKSPVTLIINPVTEVNNDIFASTDVSAYKYISLQLTGSWSGTVKFQGSNNNGTFEDIVVQNTGVVLEPYVVGMITNGGVKIPVLFKYLRIRVTDYISGTINGTAFGYKEDANTGQISTVGTVNIAAAQTLATVTNLEQLNGNPISMGSGAVDAGTIRATVTNLEQLNGNPISMGSGAVDAGTIRASVTNVEQLNGQAVAMGGGVVTAGTQRVTVATDTPVVLGAGTALIGNVKVLPSISDPVIPLKVISAVGVNATLVQAGPTNINFILIVSVAATPRFVKFYDKATAPIVGTDIPTHTFPLSVGASPIMAPPKGFNFTNGFGFAILLGVEDSSTTPFTVGGEVVMMMEYT